MKKRILAILICLVIVSIHTQSSAEIKNAGDYLKNNVVHKKLKNGINVIMLNRGYSPTLAFEISFRVGSVDESYKTIGTAHMLEHMLFKGTDRVGTKDFSKEKPILNRIEAVGETLDKLRLSNPKNTMIPELEKQLAELQKEHSKFVISSPYDSIYTSNGSVGFNASTSRDKTGYYIELPAEKLELWAKLESERLRNPVLREFYLERNNVIQERLMRYDSKGEGAFFEKFIAEAFLAHPYRHPTIGWRSNIPYLSISDVRKFYWKYYIPSRMTITIVGMQDTDRTFEMVSKYFEKIKAGLQPSDIPVKEPEQKGEKRFVFYFDSNPALLIGWHKPTFPSRDDYVLDVASEILTGGKTSRLYKKLVLEKKLAVSISAWNGSPGARYDNLFMIYATPAPGHTPEELEKAVYQEISKMTLECSNSELEKVVNKMESSMVFDLDTNSGVARLLSYYQTVFGDWTYSAKYMNVLKSVTVDEIKKISSTYLKKNNRVVGIMYDARKSKGE